MMECIARVANVAPGIRNSNFMLHRMGKTGFHKVMVLHGDPIFRSPDMSKNGLGSTSRKIGLRYLENRVLSPLLPPLSVEGSEGVVVDPARTKHMK